MRRPGKRFSQLPWCTKLTSVWWTNTPRWKAAATLWQALVAPSLLYRTLSDAGSGPEPGRVHLQVVFAYDITEREIRTLLGSIGATIVAGPSPMAVYTVALADDREAPAQAQERLALLRTHPKVRLAEAKQP